MIIKIDDKTYINYDETKKSSEVLDIDRLNSDLEFAKEKLAEIPEPLTDEELLKWAKENYVPVDYSEQLKTYTEQKEKIENLINEINSL